LKNYCQSCIDNKNGNDIIIRFDDINIEDTKTERLLSKISNNNIISFEEYSSINITKIIGKEDDDHFNIFSEKDELNFYNLIKIIINDYKNYPNFSHFFNIINLLHFFNIEEKPIIEKLENRIIKNNKPIIIKYNNNISGKTKLFSKTFEKKINLR